MIKKQFTFAIFLTFMAISLLLAACGENSSVTTLPGTTTAKSSSPALTRGGTTAPSAKPDPTQLYTDANKLNDRLTPIINSVNSKDFALAKTQVAQFDDAWANIEDGVKAYSPDSYKQIEEAIDDVKAEIVKTQNPDVVKSQASLKKLSNSVLGFANSLGVK